MVGIVFPICGSGDPARSASCHWVRSETYDLHEPEDIIARPDTVGDVAIVGVVYNLVGCSVAARLAVGFDGFCQLAEDVEIRSSISNLPSEKDRIELFE
jgi:hypothetical protein